MRKAPEPGDMAPDFTLPRDGGGTVTLSTLRGQKLVLFFYPRDDTSGCTRESIAFSEALGAFESEGATIVGISADTVASHDKFKAKHSLRVPLASDVDKSVANDYGVWVEKSMYGRKYMGIERATFLVDATGKIARVWRKVKVPGHADAVLKEIKALA